MATWLQLEGNASAAYSPNAGFYLSFFEMRNQMVAQSIGDNLRVPVVLTGSVAHDFTTSNQSFTLSGTARGTVFKIAPEAHPNLRPTWATETVWTFLDIPLRQGENDLRFKATDCTGRLLKQAGTRVIRAGPIPR